MGGGRQPEASDVVVHVRRLSGRFQPAPSQTSTRERRGRLRADLGEWCQRLAVDPRRDDGSAHGTPWHDRAEDLGRVTVRLSRTAGGRGGGCRASPTDYTASPCWPTRLRPGTRSRSSCPSPRRQRPRLRGGEVFFVKASCAPRLSWGDTAVPAAASCPSPQQACLPFRSCTTTS